MPKNLIRLMAVCLVVFSLKAADYLDDPFRQLSELLPTPDNVRTASGAPGPAYWQQRADYVIRVELDDENQRITGSEEIVYHNNSPDTLHYLWLQLDNNNLSPQSDAAKSARAPGFNKMPYRTLNRLLTQETFDGSVHITSVQDSEGESLEYRVVGTMMRIDLPEPLDSGKSVQFDIDWNYNINDGTVIEARTGYEFFKDDGNYIYEIGHWYPRMAAYTDYEGWQNKQFLGRGEFTLEFGSFQVSITAPADHVVAATGELQNPEEVLTETQRGRLADARASEKPVFIVTRDEARENEKQKANSKKTWIYKAENVRDFAFASSRKFIWDAAGHDVGGRTVMAMSFYPKEAEPLWPQYSTQAIMHTLDVYSKFTFDYPFPYAISVNGPVGGGMEYPMISFNKPRPEDDGTYDKRTKYRLISIVIHEVGHNWFPMTVNSDERQWTWMDEGLNSFLQYLAEREWEEDYPSPGAEPKNIVDYMTSAYQIPIMSNSESLRQFGNNAYAKPATALNILRETILGRDLFDLAFKEYANRWKFKRPEPADLFRTLEDASGIDLDWFWRGWFFTTEHCDMAIDAVKLYSLDTMDPVIDKARRKRDREEEPETISEIRNRDVSRRVDRFPELKDFYNDYDELEVTEKDRKKFQELLEKLDENEKDLLKTERFFYVVDFKNIGGLVMPIILKIEYEDGSKEEEYIPAEIWRYNSRAVSKLFMTRKKIKSMALDPHLQTADSDVENNYYPRRVIKERFQLEKAPKKKNPMQLENQDESGDDEAAEKEEDQ